MSPSDALSNDSELASKASRVLTLEEKAALRERVARLMTSEEFAQLLDEFQANVAKVIAITDSLLESKQS
jgi:metal-dependent amidase/aminoacylase/carboxypeptidase family protein